MFTSGVWQALPAKLFLFQAVGPVACIMTRVLFSVINSAVSWDCDVLFTQDAIPDIAFWRHNVHTLNGKV